MRLIDADALLTVPNVQKVTEYDETGEGITYLAVPVEAIEKANTIDAVPVVRCKDCIFSATFRSGNMYCKLHENYTFFTNPYGYCSHGAKTGFEG